MTQPKVNLEQSIISINFEISKEDYHMVFPQKYNTTSQIIEEHTTSENKTVRFYACGKKEIIFPTGARRESHPDGYQVIFFDNNDIRQHFPDKKIVYYFSDQKITQTITENGEKIVLFPNG